MYMYKTHACTLILKSTLGLVYTHWLRRALGLWKSTKFCFSHFWYIVYRIHHQWHLRCEQFWVEKPASTPHGNEDDYNIQLPRRRAGPTWPFNNPHWTLVRDGPLQRTPAWYQFRIRVWVPGPHATSCCDTLNPKVLSDSDHGTKVLPVWCPCGSWWYWENRDNQRPG